MYFFFTFSFIFFKSGEAKGKEKDKGNAKVIQITVKLFSFPHQTENVVYTSGKPDTDL